MSWAVGYDTSWQRDVGYGVPAWCDHPDCTAEVIRGLAYVCGNAPFGGDDGCGLYFCLDHLDGEQRCGRCAADQDPFEPKPDHPEWIAWKLTDESWAAWRAENPHLSRFR